MSGNNKLISTLLIAGVFCIGMYLVPVRMMRPDLSSIPGNIGDARLNNYFLEHGYKWLSGQEASFWDAPFFYPITQSMSFSDNLLGTLPVYSIFRFLGYDRETSFQLWFFAVFTLNYFICAYVLRRLSLNALGAASGAFLFAFSLPVIARIGHSQLLPRFMIPVAFYFSMRYFEKPAYRPLVYACLAIVAQFYCSMYMGFFLVLGLMALFVSHIMPQKDRIPWLHAMLGETYRTIITRLLIVFIAVLSLVPLILTYRKASAEFGYRSWAEIAQMLPRVTSYFYPASGSLLWGWLTPIGNTLPMSWEHQIFVGALPLAALILAPILYFRNRAEPLLKTGMLAFVTVALLVLLTLYFASSSGSSLYKIVMHLPGMGAIRAVARIILMVLFPLSIVTGVVLTKLSEQRTIVKRSLAKFAFSLIVVTVLVCDQNVIAAHYDTYSKSAAQARSLAVERLVREKGPSAKVFSYMPERSSDPPYAVHLDAMLAAQDLNMATVNGYSGNFPRDYDFFDNYDQCVSLMKWETIATERSGAERGRRDLFQDMVIAGKDSCEQDKHTYSFIEDALPHDGYRVAISCFLPRITLVRDASTTVKIQLKNTSRAAWGALTRGATEKYKIHLAYRWLSSDQKPLGDFDFRFPLPHDLLPGETTAVEVFVHAPAAPGKYFIEFDLVQELVTWFREQGSSPTRVEIRVL
jgi:hypothetical protein